MATDSGHIKGDYRRSCDICGHRWFMKRDMKYIGQNRWACPDDKDGLTEQQIARHNARVRPLIVKQHKHPKLMSQTATYKFREGLVLDAVCRLATTAQSASSVLGVQVAATTESVAWCGIYLGDMIQENERPVSWITRAKSALVDVCTFLRANQFGDGTSPTEPTNSILYGSVLAPTFGPLITDAALSGLAFLRAFRATGDSSYLVSAERVAWFLRQSQRNDLSSVCGTVDQSVHPYYIGGWPWFLSTGKAVHSNYILASAVALWFLAELKVIRGGSYVYGTTTASGDFTAPPAGSIDTMIADGMAFYFDGHALPTFSGTPLFTRPYAWYSISTTPGGVSGDYAFHMDSGQQIQSLYYAYALRGLFEVEGYTPRVADAVNWLRNFSSNPSFEGSATAAKSAKFNNGQGVYDPAFATSLILLLIKGGNPVTMNGSPYYDLRIQGILAPVLSAGKIQQADLKNFLEGDRRIAMNNTDRSTDTGNCALQGAATMALGAPSSNILPGFAAATSQIYRFAPKANNRLENPAT